MNLLISLPTHSMTMSDSSSTTLLDTIQGPDDLKKIEPDRLPELADEIRGRLITSLSNTGGHLGPNLGVVELTIAMHRVFDTPTDKFLFDVSHQGYVHKMLTGRAKKIGSIRQYEGLNGFLLRTESEHDCYGAGHAGTALSAALGMASARDLKGGDNHVVAVAGDAAFTCGPTLEALNNIAEATDRCIVVLNDNEWSIDKNVGALAKYFNTLQSHPAYNDIRAKAASLVEKVAGPGARKFAHKIERNAKNMILPNVLFEKFGMRYYGPIDGHDLPSLIKSFEYLKEQDEPVILHIITEKGRGYQPALDMPGKFHGLGPYNVEDGSTASGAPTFSELFGRAITDFAKEDKSITAITAAMPGGTKLETFKAEIPERYFDVGIAEEHAALFACGHATQGLKPFLAIYSTFMQRAYDMILHDMALQKVEDIQAIIRPCGLSPRKSKAILELSKMIVNQFDGEVPESFEELEDFPGVGHKTASVVMSQGFGHPAFPVDTHIHRLAQNWKLTNGKSVEQTEKDLKRLFPEDSWNRLHLQIIFYGREYCTARGCKGLVCPICTTMYPNRKRAIIKKG